MTTDEFYREFQRRRHKLLGAYLALRAWERNVDCVVLPRNALLPYLELEGEMKNVRLAWLKEDLSKLFPYYLSTEITKTRKFEALYLSRVEIPEVPEEEDATDDLEFASLFEKNGLRIGILDEIPGESEIIRMMADVSHGISDFSQWQEEFPMNDQPTKYLADIRRFDRKKWFES
jgi:hypothetical protein